MLMIYRSVSDYNATSSRVRDHNSQSQRNSSEMDGSSIYAVCAHTGTPVRHWARTQSNRYSFHPPFRDHVSRERTTRFGALISWRAWEANFAVKLIPFVFSAFFRGHNPLPILVPSSAWLVPAELHDSNTPFPASPWCPSGRTSKLRLAPCLSDSVVNVPPPFSPLSPVQCVSES